MFNPVIKVKIPKKICKRSIKNSKQKEDLLEELKSKCRKIMSPAKIIYSPFNFFII